MNPTKKYQIVPTSIVGESTYRKSVDKLLSLVVIPFESNPTYDPVIYPVKTQEEINLIKVTSTWYVEEEI